MLDQERALARLSGRIVLFCEATRVSHVCPIMPAKQK